MVRPTLKMKALKGSTKDIPLWYIGSIKGSLRNV